MRESRTPSPETKYEDEKTPLLLWKTLSLPLPEIALLTRSHFARVYVPNVNGDDYELLYARNVHDGAAPTRLRAYAFP